MIKARGAVRVLPEPNELFDRAPSRRIDVDQLITGGPLSRRRLGQMASTRLLSALGVTQVVYTLGALIAALMR